VKVLITGGAGFIGSHLSKHFLSMGDEVTILDNLATGNLSNISGQAVEFVNGDIRDEKLVDPLVSRSDLVLHMAAALGVERIMKEPIESISTNIFGSEVILKSASRYTKRIIIASTSEIYGKNPKQPLSENDDRVIGSPQNIRWTYSDAKAIEEAMARALHLSQGLPVTTIRFFNTVGPKQTGKYGMVVPRFIYSALKNENIAVFGDGTQSRVFCHVDDAISGLVSLVENKASIGQVFNIGGEGETTINDLAERIISQTGSKSKIINIPYSDAYPIGYEDMHRRVPNTSKIQSLTGWKPKKTLAEIIEDVSNYTRANIKA
jgi:UDP-glucose 4-epimerase